MDRWRNSPSCGSYLASPAVNHSRVGADLLPTAASQFQNFFPWQSVCLLIFPISLLPFLIWCATGMTHHNVLSFRLTAMGGVDMFSNTLSIPQFVWFLNSLPSSSSVLSHLTFICRRDCPYLTRGHHNLLCPLRRTEELPVPTADSGGYSVRPSP